MMIEAPFSPLTYDELHAMVLGTVGFWIGRLQSPRLALLLTLHAVFDCLPNAKGSSVIVREPWYFVAVLFASYLVGRLSRNNPALPFASPASRGY